MKKPALLLALHCAVSLAAQGSLGQGSFDDGVRLKNAQKLPEAVAIFQQLLVTNPHNTDALEQLAIVQGWQGRYDDSIASWQRLLTLEPQRTGARVGLARVQFWKGDRVAALRTLDAELAAHPDEADALALKAKVAAAPEFTRWRIDAGAIGDHYTSPRGNEPSGYAQIGYAFSPQSGVYFHYDWMKEFGLVDEGLVAGGYWRVAPTWLLTAEASETPAADFRPRMLVLLGTEWLATNVVQGLLGYRYMNYDLTTQATNTGTTLAGKGTVSTITPGVRLIFGAIGNLEARYGFTRNLDSSNTGVLQLRFNFDELNTWTPYLAFAHGKEALPPLAPAVVTVFSGGSSVALTPRWGARIDLAYEHRTDANSRETLYNHETVALGVSYKF